MRAIWSDAGLTDGEKVENLKWLNEILHRVTMKSALLRIHKNTFSESDSWEDIRHWVLVVLDPMWSGRSDLVTTGAIVEPAIEQAGDILR